MRGAIICLYMIRLIIMRLIGLFLLAAGIWIAVEMTRLFIANDAKQIAVLWYLPIIGIGCLLVCAGGGLLSAKTWQEVKEEVVESLTWLWLAR